MIMNGISQQPEVLVLMMFAISKGVCVITVWNRKRNSLFFLEFPQ